MEKESVLWRIQKSIFPILFNFIFFLVIFNSVFFALGGVRCNASAWISYGFIHFAYFMLLLAPKLIPAGKSEAVFGFSIYYISAVYFLVTFITGAIFLLISPLLFFSGAYKIPLVVQLCIVGFYGVILTAHMIANERTAAAEEARQPQIAFIKNASTQLKGLLESVDDKEAKKKVEKAYDAMNSSPARSHPGLEQLEHRILQAIQELEAAISTGEKDSILSLANALLAVINERNRQGKNIPP